MLCDVLLTQKDKKFLFKSKISHYFNQAVKDLIFEIIFLVSFV